MKCLGNGFQRGLVLIAGLCLSFILPCGCQSQVRRDITRHENLYFPKGAPPAPVLDLVDLRGTDADMKLAAITLQGQINAGPQAKVFVVTRDPKVNTDDFIWLDWYKQRRYIQNTNLLTPGQFFLKYDSQYDKVIVYDPYLPASINIATMMASLEKAIVVSPRDMGRLSRDKEVEDLSGRWKSNLQAYEWAYKNLRPKMNPSLLATYHPTFNTHHLRDYLIRNRVFTFWVTGKNVENEIISDYESERAFVEKVLANSPDNIPVIGWWGAVPDEGLSEYTAVGLAGKYGKLTYGCDWSTNLTVHSGIEVDIPAMALKWSAQQDRSVPELDESKVYLTYVIVESGDAPGYWLDVEHAVWSDPQRGSVPVGWSYGPAIVELLPGVMEWYFLNATSQDEFFISPSGNGYVHPYRGLFSKTKNPERAWRKYINDTSWYMDLFNIHALCLYTDAWVPFDRDEKDDVTKKFVDGIAGLELLVMGMGRDENALELGPNYLFKDSDVLVSHVVTRWDAQNIGRNEENNRWLVEEIRKHTPRDGRPAFIAVHPLSWSYFPSDLAEVSRMLGPEYKAVTPWQFRQLYLDYHAPYLLKRAETE